MTSESLNSPPPPPPLEPGTDADEQVTDQPSGSKKAKKPWHRPTFTVIDADMKLFKSGPHPAPQPENAVYTTTS